MNPWCRIPSAAKAEMERGLISERTKMGMKQLKATHLTLKPRESFCNYYYMHRGYLRMEGHPNGTPETDFEI